MNAGEAAGWLLAMRAAYLSGRVQTVCNRFAGLRAHYRIEWRMLGNGTLLVPDPGSTPSLVQCVQWQGTFVLAKLASYFFSNLDWLIVSLQSRCSHE
jgi:hypothetical protein